MKKPGLFSSQEKKFSPEVRKKNRFLNYFAILWKILLVLIDPWCFILFTDRACFFVIVLT